MSNETNTFPIADPVLAGSAPADILSYTELLLGWLDPRLVAVVGSVSERTAKFADAPVGKVVVCPARLAVWVKADAADVWTTITERDDWHAMPLSSLATAIQTGQYGQPSYKAAGGMVILSGQVHMSSTGTIGWVPPEYAPDRIQEITTYQNAGDWSATIAVIRVQTDGTIATLTPVATGDGDKGFMLSGVNWPRRG